MIIIKYIPYTSTVKSQLNAAKKKKAKEKSKYDTRKKNIQDSRTLFIRSL